MPFLKGARAGGSVSPILIDSEQLQKATGYERTSDLEKCLRKNGIPFVRGRSGCIFTTAEAVNQALGIKTANPNNLGHDDIEFT
ncbi:MAG: DUF4224 domain-containing protein [Halobacteriota archaeon]